MIDRLQLFTIDHIALTTDGNIGAIGASFFVTSTSACTIDRDDLLIDANYRSIDGNFCEIDSNDCLIRRAISHIGIDGRHRPPRWYRRDQRVLASTTTMARSAPVFA